MRITVFVQGDSPGSHWLANQSVLKSRCFALMTPYSCDISSENLLYVSDSFFLYKSFTSELDSFGTSPNDHSYPDKQL